MQKLTKKHRLIYNGNKEIVEDDTREYVPGSVTYVPDSLSAFEAGTLREITEKIEESRLARTRAVEEDVIFEREHARIKEEEETRTREEEETRTREEEETRLREEEEGTKTR